MFIKATIFNNVFNYTSWCALPQISITLHLVLASEKKNTKAICLQELILLPVDITSVKYYPLFMYIDKHWTLSHLCFILCHFIFCFCIIISSCMFMFMPPICLKLFYRATFLFVNNLCIYTYLSICLSTVCLSVWLSESI